MASGSQGLGGGRGGGGTGGGEGGHFDSFVPTSWAPGSSLGGCLPRGRDSQGVGEWVPGLIGSAQPGHAPMRLPLSGDFHFGKGGTGRAGQGHGKVKGGRGARSAGGPHGWGSWPVCRMEWPVGRLWTGAAVPPMGPASCWAGWWGTVHAPRPQEITGETGRRGRRGSRALKPAGISERRTGHHAHVHCGQDSPSCLRGVYIPAREPSIRASLEELEMLVKAGWEAQAET